MGLIWNTAAFIATIALLLICGAVFNKAKEKKDSPLRKIVEKFKRKKFREIGDDSIHYKRLSHKGGVKWVLMCLSLSMTIILI